MPAYDYRCGNCHQRVTLRYRTYADYDKAVPICPKCGSSALSQLVGRITVAKSDDRRFDDLAVGGDDTAFDNMAEADPVTLGRYMRRMGEAMGEDMGDEYHEVVNRLEHGEDPEAIESSLESAGEESGMGMGSDMGMSDFGGFGGGESLSGLSGGEK